MKVDMIVLRHPSPGASVFLSKNVNSCIINASPHHNHKMLLKLVDFNEIKYICDCVIEKKEQIKQNFKKVFNKIH